MNSILMDFAYNCAHGTHLGTAAGHSTVESNELEGLGTARSRYDELMTYREDVTALAAGFLSIVWFGSGSQMMLFCFF
jgi:hypothetical protein